MIAQQLEAKKDVRKENQILAKNTVAELGNSLPVSLRRPMEMAQERGASSWLTSLPIEEFNFTLHKGAFHDAIAIRYGWSPSRMPKHCDCGSKFSLEHSFSCPKGGFPSIRHNEIRDLTANLLSEVCNDCIEPCLQSLSGEILNGATSNIQDGARLDIAANGFWGGQYKRTYFDIRVFNPLAPSHRQHSLPSCYTGLKKIFKNALMNRELGRSNTLHLLHWFSLPQVDWQTRQTCFIIVLHPA